MSCLRKRRGAWVVDAYIHGQRIVKSYGTKREAEETLAKLNLERRKKSRPAVDPFVRLADYVPRYLAECREQEVAPPTLERYERTLENHVLPALGQKRLRDITRADVRTWLLSKREQGANLQGLKGVDRQPKGALAKNTVKQLRSVLSAVLSLAVDDEVIPSNPALGVFRERRTKAAKRRARAKAGETVKAMDREQRNRLLSVAAEKHRDEYPALMLMALAGLRLGEALGLRWPSVDLQGRKLRVHEQVLSDSTKSGTERFVDMAAPLAEVLRRLQAHRRQESLAGGGGGEISPYVVFPWLSEKPNAQEEQKAAKRVRRAMERSLKAAGLPQHFTPHALRHTFCSLLISDGVSPVYVQQQAGHASVEMTVGVYGSWFALEAPGAMDRLADGLPGQPVTKTPSTGNIANSPPPQALAPTGTCGARTASRPSPC